MSSWISRSLGNDKDEEEEEEEEERRGVKEDLSVITKGLKRQLWGVASFIAPPPPPTPILHTYQHDRDDDDDDDATSSLYGIRSDIREISGTVKTGISKLASNFFSFKGQQHDADVDVVPPPPPPPLVSNHEKDDDEDEGGDAYEDEDEDEDDDNDEDEIPEMSDVNKAAIGITDEVLTFAKNISMHPETWLDFPCPSEDDVVDDYDMSEIQKEHASAIEHLAPRLAALRIELCPSLMTEGRFWKIYFVLLHSRLNKQDASLLSTPRIVEARGLLMQELQKRTRCESLSVGTDVSRLEGKQTVLSFDQKPSGHVLVSDEKSEFCNIVSPIDEQYCVTSSQRIACSKNFTEDEPIFENKSVLSGTVKFTNGYHDEDAETDDWLKEENIGDDASLYARERFEDDEDVSFSDLEDEDDSTLPKSCVAVKDDHHPSNEETKGWIELRRSPSHMETASITSISSLESTLFDCDTFKGDRDSLKSRNLSAWKHATGETNDWLTINKEDAASSDSS